MKCSVCKRIRGIPPLWKRILKKLGFYSGGLYINYCTLYHEEEITESKKIIDDVMTAGSYAVSDWDYFTVTNYKESESKLTRYHKLVCDFCNPNLSWSSEQGDEMHKLEEEIERALEKADRRLSPMWVKWVQCKKCYKDYIEFYPKEQCKCGSYESEEVDALLPDLIKNTQKLKLIQELAEQIIRGELRLTKFFATDIICIIDKNNPILKEPSS